MVVPAIIGILLIRVLTTIFTHEEYGQYNITLSTLGLLKVFSVIWLSSSCMRFFISYKKNNDTTTFLSTLLISSVISSILGCLFAFIINYFYFQNRLDPTLFSLINLAICASFFITFFEIFVVIFRAGLEAKKYSFYWLLYAIGKPIIGIVLILYFNMRVDGIFWGFLITPLILDIFLIFKLRLITVIKSFSFSAPLAKQFFTYGYPLAFSNFAFWILSLSDRYLIEYFKGSAEVGLYSVGFSISEKTLQFTFMTLMLAAYPIIIENWEKSGKESTQNLITEISRYFFLFITPILTVLLVIPRDVLLFFADKQFLAGARVLPFIAMGIFLLGLTQYVMKGFELHKNSAKIAQLALLAGGCNIGLNLVLIPRFGYIGASISSCTAYAIYFLSSIFAVRNYLKWKSPVRSIGNIVISAIFMGVVLKLGTPWINNTYLKLLIMTPVGLLVYASMLKLTGEIKKSETDKAISFIKNLIKK